MSSCLGCRSFFAHDSPCKIFTAVGESLQGGSSEPWRLLDAVRGRCEYVNVPARALKTAPPAPESASASGAELETLPRAAGEAGPRPADDDPAIVGVAITLGGAATNLTYHQVARGRKQLERGVEALTRLAGMNRKKKSEELSAESIAAVGAETPQPPQLKSSSGIGGAALIEAITTYEVRAVCDPTAAQHKP